MKKYRLHLKLVTLIVKYEDDIAHCYSYCGQLSEEAREEYRLLGLSATVF